MMTNQEYGFPEIQNNALILTLKQSFEDFSSWAMIGEGRDKHGFFISSQNLQKMLDENKTSDGFKICLGINEIKDENEEITNRSIELIMTAVTFEEVIDEDMPYPHSNQKVYSSINPIDVEPPVLQCPPLRCK